MNLVQLVYASQATKGLSLDDARAIARVARKNNQQRGLSSVLMFGDDCFMQMLEGGSSTVNETFERIYGDARHENVHLLSFRTITRRSYSGWAMVHIDSKVVGRSILHRFSSGYDFHPQRMTSEQAVEFAGECAAAYDVAHHSTN